MFMQTVMRIVGRITALFSQAYVWIKTQLSTPASNLLARFTRIFQNVRNLHLLNLLRVQTGLSSNRLVVYLITAEQSIKLALMSVLAKLILLGQQLVTTVRQILQPVVQALKQKANPVELIKLVVSAIQKLVVVLTPMVAQLKDNGLKLQGLVRQLQQRVSHVFKKGN
jgi:hypothetical protein